MSHDGFFDSFGAVFLAVVGDKQTFISSKDEQETVIVKIPEVACVKPAVTNCFSRRLLVFPVPCHDVFPFDNNFTMLARCKRISFFITDFYFEIRDDASRRPELMFLRNVCRYHRRRLGQSVALEHRDSDGVEKSLQFDVEQRSAADEELESAAEILAYFPEEDFVEKHGERLLQFAQALSTIPAVAVIVVRKFEGFLKKFLDDRPFLFDAVLDVLSKVFCKRWHA